MPFYYFIDQKVFESENAISELSSNELNAAEETFYLANKSSNPDKAEIQAQSLNATINNYVNEQTGASYTLALQDANRLVAMNNASANTLTVDIDANVDFPVGTTIPVVQLGAGTTTIAPASGTVNIQNTNGLSLGTQYQMAMLIKIDTNEWVCVISDDGSGGSVTINDTFTSTATDEAASANRVKLLKDLIDEIADTARTFTAPQRTQINTSVTNNAIDLSVANDHEFSTTAHAISFTNLTAGQKGTIYVDNTSDNATGWTDTNIDWNGVSDSAPTLPASKFAIEYHVASDGATVNVWVV